MRKCSVALCVALALTGCAVGPDYQRPAQELPQAWQGESADAQQQIARDWWRGFGDERLNTLVSEALEHNRDLVASAARVDEARAQAGIARAALLPQVSAEGSFQRNRVSQEMYPAPYVRDARTANGVLSWELDLWGKLRRADEAARADFAAARLTRDAAELSIAAQVAQTYFQLLAYDAQLDITRRTLSTRDESLKLNKRRFEGGMTSELDFRQAEAEAAAARAQVPVLEQSVRQTENALAVLVGRSPRAMVEGKLERAELGGLAVPPVVSAGLPSSLLTRRPDVLAAEEQLHAANARIGVARAAYFPSIGLTSAIGSQSADLGNLFTGPARTWSFAANLAMPIFDWGKTGAGVDAANARQRQALAQYDKAIQTAFRETLDALSATTTSTQRESAQRTQLNALKNTLKLAKLRYDNGYSSYLEVLDAERGAFQAELQLVDARLNQLNASVSLVKALGGGWQAAKAG